VEDAPDWFFHPPTGQYAGISFPEKDSSAVAGLLDTVFDKFYSANENLKNYSLSLSLPSVSYYHRKHKIFTHIFKMIQIYK
jgi:hypothetical protein